MSKSPSLQDVITGMELSGAYRGIFPEIFKFTVLDILLTLPVVTVQWNILLAK